MIIKSMSRKEPSFAQLYDYITRDESYNASYRYAHNFFVQDRDQIIEEFERNAKLCPKRKNGNYLYHEIISITRSDAVSEKRQMELLRNVANLYIQERAKNCLVFGGLHDEKDDNLHIHLMISANELDQSKKHRLTKANFNQIKRNIESYVLERYPELKQEVLITQSVEELKVKRQRKQQKSEKEYQYSKRTGKLSQKEQFKMKLQGVFDQCSSKQEFFDLLAASHIEIYHRGKTIGFLDQNSGRKHRLKTLGLESEFERVNSTLEQTKANPNSDKSAETQKTTRSQSKTSSSDEKVKKSEKESDERLKSKSKKQHTIEKRQTSMKKKRKAAHDKKTESKNRQKPKH